MRDSPGNVGVEFLRVECAGDHLPILRGVWAIRFTVVQVLKMPVMLLRLHKLSDEKDLK